MGGSVSLNILLRTDLAGQGLILDVLSLKVREAWLQLMCCTLLKCL